MAAPVITITSINRIKISNKDGRHRALIKFTSDQDLVDFIVKVNGTSHSTGSDADYSYSRYIYPSNSLYPSSSVYLKDYLLKVGEEEIAIVDYTELSGEGDYRINVYGCNSNGEWSNYG